MSAVAKSANKPLTRSEARELTDCIKGAIAIAWDLIVKAYDERAWTALGYAKWDEYCEAEFGTTRLRLPREERAEVVASLRESGLSIRAIASATGLSKNTVQSDVSQIGTTAPGGVTESTPGQTDRVAAALAAAQAKQDVAPVEPIVVTPEMMPERITGIDGKSYPKPTVATKPRRWPISNDAVKISLELSRVVNRMRKLVDDDRFTANRDMIGRQFRPYLPAGIEVLNRLDDVAEKPVIEPEPVVETITAPDGNGHRGDQLCVMDGASDADVEHQEPEKLWTWCGGRSHEFDSWDAVYAAIEDNIGGVSTMIGTINSRGYRVGGNVKIPVDEAEFMGAQLRNLQAALCVLVENRPDGGGADA